MESAPTVDFNSRTLHGTAIYAYIGVVSGTGSLGGFCPPRLVRPRRFPAVSGFRTLDGDSPGDIGEVDGLEGRRHFLIRIVGRHGTDERPRTD